LIASKSVSGFLSCSQRATQRIFKGPGLLCPRGAKASIPGGWIDDFLRMLSGTYDIAPLREPLRETTLAVFLVGSAQEAFMIAILRAEATLRGTQCLVALRRWQLEHEELPKDIDTLVKAAGMPGVPIGPFSDQPLRMAVIEGKPVIYSVGPDGKDDKALLEWEYGRQPGDIIFRLEPPSG
jgi:hypothetical protein